MRTDSSKAILLILALVPSFIVAAIISATGCDQTQQVSRVFKKGHVEPGDGAFAREQRGESVSEYVL